MVRAQIARLKCHAPTLRAVALFVFLAGAAGAGIVAAYFFLRADDLLHLLRISGAGHAGLFQLAALAAHEGFFQVVGRSCDQARRFVAVPTTSLL